MIPSAESQRIFDAKKNNITTNKLTLAQVLWGLPNSLSAVIVNILHKQLDYSCIWDCAPENGNHPAQLAVKPSSPKYRINQSLSAAGENLHGKRNYILLEFRMSSHFYIEFWPNIDSQQFSKSCLEISLWKKQTYVVTRGVQFMNNWLFISRLFSVNQEHTAQTG